jgi:RNA polymerase sigma-70 factor (ECF subfamily)
MRDLLTKALEGDKKAEKRIFELLRVRFSILAKLHIGSEYAEDVAQEACMTVAQKYKSLSHYEEFEAWAYGVLKNKIGNFLKRAKKRQKYISDLSVSEEWGIIPTPDKDPLLERSILDCLKVIAGHNIRYARILNMVHLGYSVDDMCRRLRISRNHLYVLLHRGRHMLKECLEGNNG